MIVIETLHRFTLDGVQRMRERPIQDLVDGLVQLGVDAKCTLGTGCPPVEVNAKGLPSGKVSVGAHCAVIQQMKINVLVVWYTM